MLQEMHWATKGEQHTLRGKYYTEATDRLNAERADGKHQDVSNREFKKLKTALSKAFCEG